MLYPELNAGLLERTCRSVHMHKDVCTCPDRNSYMHASRKATHTHTPRIECVWYWKCIPSHCSSRPSAPLWFCWDCFPLISFYCHASKTRTARETALSVCVCSVLHFIFPVFVRVVCVCCLWTAGVCEWSTPRSKVSVRNDTVGWGVGRFLILKKKRLSVSFLFSSSFFFYYRREALEQENPLVRDLFHLQFSPLSNRWGCCTTWVFFDLWTGWKANTRKRGLQLLTGGGQRRIINSNTLDPPFAGLGVISMLQWMTCSQG